MIFSKIFISALFEFCFFILFFEPSSAKNIVNPKAIYYNPILDYAAPDPFIYLHTDGFYYLTYSNTKELYIYKSSKLTDFRDAERKLIANVPVGYIDLWAPEIHFINGEFYIYFAMNTVVDHHKMFVIKALASDPMGIWSTATRLRPQGDDLWAIDGTILQYGDGKLYFIFSGFPNGHYDVSTAPQCLYIASMSNPMTLSSPALLLRQPSKDWEMHGTLNGTGVNEGPQVVVNPNSNRTFLIFSASGVWTPDYCLGLIGIDDLRNPMNVSNWWQDVDRCVFFRNDAQNVYCTGHAMVTYSPDKTESWIAYHAWSALEIGPGDNRTARVEKINWNIDGTPEFPRPSGFSVPLQTPSGQK